MLLTATLPAEIQPLADLMIGRVMRHVFHDVAGLPYRPRAWNDLDETAFERFIDFNASEIASSSGKRSVHFADVELFAQSASQPIMREFRRVVGNCVQLRANCYAYAANDWSNPVAYLALPGFATGVVCDNPVERVERAAELTEHDGLRPIDTPDDIEPGEYPVALVTAPGIDFHYYRRNDDGTWSHKPGLGKVLNRDAEGHLIWDPRRADRFYGIVDYSEFKGFYAVPVNGIAVGVPEEDRAALRVAEIEPADFNKFVAEKPWTAGFYTYGV